MLPGTCTKDITFLSLGCPLSSYPGIRINLLQRWTVLLSLERGIDSWIASVKIIIFHILIYKHTWYNTRLLASSGPATPRQLVEAHSIRWTHIFVLTSTIICTNLSNSLKYFICWGSSLSQLTQSQALNRILRYDDKIALAYNNSNLVQRYEWYGWYDGIIRYYSSNIEINLRENRHNTTLEEKNYSLNLRIVLELVLAIHFSIFYSEMEFLDQELDVRYSIESTVLYYIVRWLDMV